MNKITKYIFAAAIILISSDSFAQKFYIKLNGGYNWGTSALNGNNTTYAGNIVKFERIKVPLGQGFSLNLAIGHMINKYLGIETSVNYLIGGTTSLKSVIPNSTNISKDYSSTMLSCIPSIIFTPGYDKINPYAKLGLIIGSGTYTIKSEDVSTIGGGSYTTTNNTLLYNGGLAIGFLSSFGCLYKIKKQFSLFGEISLINLSYSPTKSEVIERKTNGVNQLPNLSTSDKITEYYDSYSEDNSIPPDKNVAKKDLLRDYPFNSVGFNIGIQYHF